MIRNFVKELIVAEENVVGIWNLIPSHHVVEIIASTGLNFQILDMEHGAFDVESVLNSIQAMGNYECSPIVRIPYIEQTLIQRLLDCGSHGILAPQIRIKEDAEKLVSYCTYAPEGLRGFNPFTRSGNYIGESDSVYNKKNFPLLIGIIENNDALDNIDAILEVSEIDVWYIGIYDLSCSLGLKGQLDHPKVLEIFDLCYNKIREHGKILGKMVDDIFQENNDSSNFLVLKPDTYQFISSIKSKIIHQRE